MNKFIAFIPLRGGSKGIPLKNIKEICGRALAKWCIEAAICCPYIDRVYVATDHQWILETLSIYSLKVEAFRVDYMDSKCMQEKPMLDFAKDHDFENIILMQATSPLTIADDLTGGINEFLNGKWDSVVSVCRQHKFLWKWSRAWETHFPLNYDPEQRPRRQEWSGHFVENGAFFITSRRALLESECRISGKVGLYEMPEDTYYELDTLTDWVIVEQLLKRRQEQC